MAPIDRLSAAERAYRTIRGQIVSLDLKPNEVVGETMLADRLGMSRTPVREALTRLSAERLVEVRARSGVTVAPIRLRDVEIAHFVREKLELAILAAAIDADDPHTQLMINQAIDEQKFAATRTDPQLFFAADERMHRMFCRLAAREEVWSVVSDAKIHLDRLRRLSLKELDFSLLIADHEKIVRAVREGQREQAQAAMVTHLGRVMADVRALAKLFPDFFQIEPDGQHNDGDAAGPSEAIHV